MGRNPSPEELVKITVLLPKRYVEKIEALAEKMKRENKTDRALNRTDAIKKIVAAYFKMAE